MKIATYFKAQLKTSLSHEADLLSLPWFVFFFATRQVWKVFLWWVWTCMAMTAIPRNLVFLEQFHSSLSPIAGHILKLPQPFLTVTWWDLGAIEKSRQGEMQRNSYHNTIGFGPTSQWSQVPGRARSMLEGETSERNTPSPMTSGSNTLGCRGKCGFWYPCWSVGLAWVSCRSFLGTEREKQEEHSCQSYFSWSEWELSRHATGSADN